MTIFNDLSLNSAGAYPSIKLHFENGNEVLIEDVHFYSVYKINGAERVRVHTSADNPTEYGDVQYIYNTNYKH